MSWLTQAELRRDTPQARQLTMQLLDGARRDSGHALVWTLFSADPDAARDFLYREEGAGRFLIVSARKPQAEPALWTIRSCPYAPQVRIGWRYGFSLRANPTVAVSRPERARSHRADVLMHAKRAGKDQIEAARTWLYDREAGLGVEFERGHPDDAPFGGLQVGRIDRIDLNRPGAAKRANLTVVDYDGVLAVTDPERLMSALAGGVGRGKAFGLGLLLLRHLGD